MYPKEVKIIEIASNLGLLIYGFTCLRDLAV